jgi:hypothetical protein
MSEAPKRRGRPPTGTALNAAERMRRYRARKQRSGLRLSSRWVDGGVAAGGTYSDHCRLDARSLALHCAIARKIDKNPALLDIAHRNITVWGKRYGEAIPKYLLEWKQILRRPWPEIAAVMTAPSERSTALRQSSPFAGVLSAAERRRIYDAFRA